MAQLILEYVLIVILVLGLSYLIYIVKEKGVRIEEDYYGVGYTILDDLAASEATTENIKNILRAVGTVVQLVECNYKDETNGFKEKLALELSKDSIKKLGFRYNINDESIIQLIRLATAFFPSIN
ncbi:MAG: hypothetical protein Q8936_09930 [Bacillota bacterium]|nr:hypothetical protein [Bacillota bacterium]